MIHFVGSLEIKSSDKVVVISEQARCGAVEVSVHLFGDDVSAGVIAVSVALRVYIDVMPWEDGRPESSFDVSPWVEVLTL